VLVVNHLILLLAHTGVQVAIAAVVILNKVFVLLELYLPL